MEVKGVFIYRGNFENDEFEGYGKYEDLRRHIVYEGYFKNGKKEGKGLETGNNGLKYEGDFNNNIRHGKGELHFQQRHYIG